MASKKRKKKSRRRVAGRGAQPKMSAVILELADPLLKRYASTPDLTQKIIAIAIAAWNKAVLPADMQEGFDRKVLESLGRAADDKEGREVVTYIMEFMAEQRRRYYPNLWKYIVSFDIGESGGQISLNVASTALTADRRDDV